MVDHPPDGPDRFADDGAVFKALADATRRAILDALFLADGQTLGQLERRFAMSRFGVMKHLKVLEDARLVTARRHGREKHHYLNPVPIRELHDRWIAKYAEPVVGGLAALRADLEQEQQTRWPRRSTSS